MLKTQEINIEIERITVGGEGNVKELETGELDHVQRMHGSSASEVKCLSLTSWSQTYVPYQDPTWA